MARLLRGCVGRTIIHLGNWAGLGVCRFAEKGGFGLFVSLTLGFDLGV
jgi:hypothetical protein